MENGACGVYILLTLHKGVNNFCLVHPKATYVQVIWQDAHKVFLVQYNTNIFSVLLLCVT
jgi:hypothetical protein